MLARYARSVLSDFTATRDEMAAIGSGLRGTLRLGCVAGAVPGLLAEVVREYKERHPRVALTITVSTSDSVIDQLADGEFDLVLGRLQNRALSDEYRIVPLLDEQQVVVVRADHPLTRRSRITLEDLIAFPLILQPDGSPAGEWMTRRRNAPAVSRGQFLTKNRPRFPVVNFSRRCPETASADSPPSAHRARRYTGKSDCAS